MSSFPAIIKQELLSARRERLPQVLLAIFLTMTAISCFIGWATNHTVTNVYNEALRQGITKAPNPFTGVTPLYYARNTVIYIVLIGALLAIILGVQSMLRDRKAHVTDLLLSRPLRTPVYLGAKLAGLGLWLLLILAVSAVINWLSISIITAHLLSPQNFLHLMSFYLVAWLFLQPFVILGLLSGLYARRETSALLIPIVIWSIVAFVLPQLGTAEHPVSLLNPVPAQIVSHGFFFHVNQTIFGPLSLTEHFKHASGVILKDSEVHGGVASNLGIIFAFTTVSLAGLLVTSRERLINELYE